MNINLKKHVLAMIESGKSQGSVCDCLINDEDPDSLPFCKKHQRQAKDLKLRAYNIIRDLNTIEQHTDNDFVVFISSPPIPRPRYHPTTENIEAFSNG